MIWRRRKNKAVLPGFAFSHRFRACIPVAPDPAGTIFRGILFPVPYEKHLLIDGSNIMHASPELRSLLRTDRDLARARLSQLVSVIHDAEEVRLTIVFDGRGDELSFECPTRSKTFAHVYTPAGTTADDFIEQVVGKSAAPGACLVATDDRAERQTVEAAGAGSLSATDLFAWVERAGRRQDSQLDTRRRNNDKDWKHN